MRKSFINELELESSVMEGDPTSIENEIIGLYKTRFDELVGETFYKK